MRKSLADWESEMTAAFPDAEVTIVKQHGGILGAFAHNKGEHVGSWPSWLIPGYRILSPIRETAA